MLTTNAWKRVELLLDRVTCLCEGGRGHGEESVRLCVFDSALVSLGVDVSVKSSDDVSTMLCVLQI